RSPDGATPVDDASTPNDTGTGNDGATASDTGGGGTDSGPTCSAPAQVTGQFTPCFITGNTFGFANCVDYCKSVGKCCAETCSPSSPDHSTTAAEYDNTDFSHCDDPLLSGGDSHGNPTCNDSPIPLQRAVKCCCGS